MQFLIWKRKIVDGHNGHRNYVMPFFWMWFFILCFQCPILKICNQCECECDCNHFPTLCKFNLREFYACHPLHCSSPHSLYLLSFHVCESSETNCRKKLQIIFGNIYDWSFGNRNENRKMGKKMVFNKILYSAFIWNEHKYWLKKIELIIDIPIGKLIFMVLWISFFYLIFGQFVVLQLNFGDFQPNHFDFFCNSSFPMGKIPLFFFFFSLRLRNPEYGDLSYHLKYADVW